MMDALTTNFTEEELKEIFEKMDWDKNGYITPIEFKSYLASLKKGEEMSAEEVYDAFDQIDTDGSKQIQWDEFLEAMTSMGRRKSVMSEGEITKIFRTADVDCDGYISFKEARRAYKKVCKLLKKDNEEEAIHKWLETVDFDHDGRISLEEFMLSIAGNTLVDEV